MVVEVQDRMVAVGTFLHGAMVGPPTTTDPRCGEATAGWEAVAPVEGGEVTPHASPDTGNNLPPRTTDENGSSISVLLTGIHHRTTGTMGTR